MSKRAPRPPGARRAPSSNSTSGRIRLRPADRDRRQPDRRLRYAYGTLGGLLAGQANSNFSDSDAGMETISFGGRRLSGRLRVPQVRYTMPMAGWGFLGRLVGVGRNPGDRRLVAGQRDHRLPTRCGRRRSASASNPTKSPAPDLTVAWYIPQPWGHIDFGAVVRPDLHVKDGGAVDRTHRLRV